MRAFVLGGILLLTGCATSSTAAKAGMSVDDYKQSCDGISRVETMSDRYVGECSGKPTEYAEFRAGKIVNIMDTEGIIAFARGLYCEPDEAECEDTVRQYVAEQEAMKLSVKRKHDRERQQAFSAALSNMGAALQGDPPSNSSISSSASSGTTCFAKGSTTSGFNKICAYDCLGSAAAITIGSTELCPLTIER